MAECRKGNNPFGHPSQCDCQRAEAAAAEVTELHEFFGYGSEEQ